MFNSIIMQQRTIIFRNTAYFGFLEICNPKAGETVVITSAAGAVGSHVGQIAKIKGCRVIGLTSSEKKAQWLTSLGFDHVINYKTTNNLQLALAEAAPRGVDIYFDNVRPLIVTMFFLPTIKTTFGRSQVGGEISSIIIRHMNQFGRISVCGSISSYNNDVRNLPKGTLHCAPPIATDNSYFSF